MSKTSKRKKHHLDLFRTNYVDMKQQSTWFEHVHLLHNALPELHTDEIAVETTFLGYQLKTPFIIAGMTGGTQEAGEINKALAANAQQFGFAFGVGSQRAMIEKPELVETYNVRSVAPSVFVMGNIGMSQITQYRYEQIQTLVDAIDANALCIHLNICQEIIQPEGDKDFTGIKNAIAELQTKLSVPIILKETGAGLSKSLVASMKQRHILAYDVGGAGGTSWSGVEILRDNRESDLSVSPFWDWGIPTAASLLELQDMSVDIIATGGIRTGLDAAKAVCLGARIVGVAAPLMRAYFENGYEGVATVCSHYLSGLKTTMALTGCASLSELNSVEYVLHGPLYEWYIQRILKDDSRTS